MKTFLACAGGLLLSAVLITGACCVVYVADALRDVDNNLDLANSRLAVLMKYSGINEHV